MVDFFIQSNQNTNPKGRALQSTELSLKRKERELARNRNVSIWT